MQEKFLPIGTVCILKDATKKVMIAGFCATGVETGDKVFDYIGCLYPEGILSSDRTLLFNHEQIEKIYYMGFVNEEEKTFKEKVKEILKKVEESKIETLDDEEDRNSEIFDSSIDYSDMSIPTATIVSED